MSDYSIVRIGSEYVVHAGKQGILRLASRRRALKLVADATGLLEAPLAPSDGDPSISREHPELP